MSASEHELIASPDAVTAEWLTGVLRANRLLDGGAVSSIDWTPVGTGQVGDSIRFTLGYEGPDAGPATIVGKFPAADETSRNAAAATRTYEVETRFYQQLRHRVGITTPVPLLALLDLSVNEFVLLMNDLAPAEQGDQIAGCGRREAELAVDQAALLHAPVWGDPTLAELAWLDRNGAEGAAFSVGLFQMFWPSFLERFDGRVEPEVVEVGSALMARIGDYLAPTDGPRTAVHGDFRLDNMLFDGDTLTTVDWQTVSLGTGPSDVAYFTGTGLERQLRATIERDLVERYHDALCAGGVADYPLERCWTDYRRSSFAGMLMAVLASMLVGQTDRGDEMFMAMANRSGTMAVDLDALALLD